MSGLERLQKALDEYPSYEQMSKHPAIQELTNFILIRDDHFEKIKELVFDDPATTEKTPAKETKQ